MVIPGLQVQRPLWHVEFSGKGNAAFTAVIRIFVRVHAMEVGRLPKHHQRDRVFPNLAIAATVFALGAIRTMCISKAAFTAAIAAIGTIRTYDATVAAAILRNMEVSVQATLSFRPAHTSSPKPQTHSPYRSLTPQCIDCRIRHSCKSHVRRQCIHIRRNPPDKAPVRTSNQIEPASLWGCGVPTPLCQTQIRVLRAGKYVDRAAGRGTWQLGQFSARAQVPTYRVCDQMCGL